MFWIRFRQISAAVSLGSFRVARSVRAAMLSADRRQQGRGRTAAEERRELRQPAPSECSGNADSRSLTACPEQYRNAWFTNVPGPVHAQLLNDRLSDACEILSASTNTSACLPPAANLQAAAAFLLPRAVLRARHPSPLLLPQPRRPAHRLQLRRPPLLLSHPS